MKFPKEFLLGASTAAHQVEGNNRYSDLWAQEQMEHSSFAEPSNDAVDHYHRYEEDIALLAGAGLNAYRFSIEWARVEPQEGCFDESELEHYRKVIRCCRGHGVEPVVTLHHFSSPKWLIERGGWEAESTVDYFKRYAVKVVEAFGDELHYICTINEANMGLQIAAISKRYMMQMQKAAAARAAAGQAESSVQMGMNLQKIRPKVFLGCIPYTLLLVAGATGRTAGGGLLGGLVGSAAGRTASSGLLSGLVGSTASRSRGGSRLLVPAKEIRKSHGCLPPNNIQWAFRPPVPLLYLKHISGTSTHNFIT